MKSTARAFAAGLLLALPHLAFGTPLAAQETADTVAADAPAEPVWPFEVSDVEVDRGYVFGRLDNGMRYILRENATPEGTALVRMRIDSGSLDETESERGLSHYLEHMAFNGSSGIPEGEMIKLLEREGLAFGADTNASTGFDAITYKLNLPRNDEALLDTALMLMRETASELTIAEDAVERERGVILAERRDRRNFAQRAREDSFAFTSPDARYPDRLPIGTLDVLESAGAAELRALYRRTYTPANTVLVVVGDFPTALVEAKIRERFGDWQGGPAPADPVTGPIDIDRQGLTDIYLDPALSENVSISRFSPWRDEPDTLANRDVQALRGIGYAIVNRRLARLARGEDAPFRGASYGTGDVFEDARVTGISISTPDGEWMKGMLAAVREVNEALTHGFTQAEIDEQLANYRTALENAVKAADTRANAAYVGEALSLVANERIPTDPAFRLANFERLAGLVTPESVHRALRDHAAPLGNPLIRFQGRTAPEGGEEALRAAFDEAMALPIAAPVDNGPLEFAYSDFGVPGEIVSDTVNERLGIRMLRFANGVRLNLKPTEIREDRISWRMSIDGGTLLNTSEDPLKTAMVGALGNGGLGRHSVDELQTVLAGRSVGVRVGSSAEFFTFSGTTTPRDLDLQMQLLTASLTDPGYRREGEERYRRNIANFFANLDATPGRALSNALGAILSDGDPRFSLQDEDAFLARDYGKLRADIGDRFGSGAIELALVGDFDPDAAIAAVAATLGALPEREAEFQRREKARLRSFTANRGLTTLTHGGEADQALVRLTWPTNDDDDFAEELKLTLLARIVRLELTERLREELGQAYSPSAGSSSSSVYPDYGTFRVQASVDVTQVEPTRAAIVDLIEDLRTKPIDPDLIERARKPILESYDNLLKGLGGWMSLTGLAQEKPRRIDRYFAAPDLLKSFTPEDVQAMAVQYLDPAAAVEIHVLPGENAKPADEDPKSEEPEDEIEE
ncbi:pitrilysin family protein [Erythrobacter sp. JK5]|uniref:M16 family metallopeptidase n=1 Tax=Erythrobacter sp. JK5 TaxID=2829500 RepID=UPI001BA9D9AA|nr:M16 family metallopeptidase [Erythrobacter sp. JK5]QUL39265.1 insulinase family protein [Erythrobacter sp. JK5]